MNTTTMKPGRSEKPSTTPRKRHGGLRRVFALLIALVAGVSLAACSGPAGANSASSDTPRLKVALITHADPGDTWFDILRKGAEAAAAKDNTELLYSSDPDGGKQAQLILQAVDQKVDGIVVTLSKPDAVGDAIKSAVAAGIPVVTINGNEDRSPGLGAIASFGQNETLAGEAVGEKLNEVGAKKIVCVIHSQGQTQLEDRCAGVKSKFSGQFELLYTNIADMASVSSTITSKLQTNQDIDYLVTLGAPIAMTAIDSVQGANSKTKIATFDMNADAIKALQDGRIQFLVDQQPYLQGYGGVDNLWLYNTNGNSYGGGKPVFTGPSIITPEQADKVADYAAKGTR
ncbi:substrate-binding domain-containing protein [Pseudoclavibacter sp. 13-3]|uniref:substrate-binding domain-containing protein n=1 Tax=Pseudoclavibacter sp. 13-3 TaxID=2901228 RepID=UPI001E4877EC|nr:substrate-binding domain-containing protein [Pseudoclavibacter sp. 13-3]MCD7101574.1 substrate-binding domain-containing protein [Pseudoclavibacter sp. 13-3]